MANQTNASVLEEAKRVGIVPDDLLEQLTTLPPEVLSSAKLRYLLTSDLYKYGMDVFMKIFTILKKSCVTQIDGNLSSKHIFDLAEILVPHASRWRLTLRFKPQKLDAIQAKHALMPNSLELSLIAILEFWINRESRNAMQPTLKNLDKALRSQVAGLGSLSSAIKRAFTSKDDCPPFNIQHICLSSEHSQKMGIRQVVATEGLFLILLEVEVPVSKENFNYQWQESGRLLIVEEQSRQIFQRHVRLLLSQFDSKFSPRQKNERSFIDDKAQHNKLFVEKARYDKEAMYVGSNSPFLCFPADLDCCGIYSCFIMCAKKSKESHAPLTPTPEVAGHFDRVGVDILLKSEAENQYAVSTAVNVCVECPLDNYSSDLVSMYLDQPEVPEDTWPPVSSKKFINLAVITQEPMNYRKKFSQRTIRKNLDDIPLAKEKIEYEQVIDGLKSKHVLFIEGRPGSGKTTLVHKIAQDWATKVKKGCKGPLRLVLLVSLRVLNSLDKPSLVLVDILNLFRSLKVSKELLEERKGKGVCFIFDGLDEFSPQDGENSVVYKIIKKRYLEKSTVIVASRPAATAPLRSKANKVVEVLGFLNEQIWEYFDCYPFTEDSKVVELKKYLLDHPNVLHMCYLPIHASMIAYLYDVTGHIPRTETEIYPHFTNLTILRSLSKNTPARDIDVCNLSSDEQKVYDDVCHLAFEKTLSSKQVLRQSECKFKLGQEDKDASLGLIVVDRTASLYGYERIYTFLHLTFQEYLAACYISKLGYDEQCQIIESHGDKNHMLTVWKFYCGLVKTATDDTRFKSLLFSTAGRHLYHLQCAYESQQNLACTQVLKSMKYNIELKNEYLSTPDFTAIGFVTSKSVIPTKLSLSNCNISIEAVSALLSEITDKGKPILKSIHYKSIVVSDDDISCIQTLQQTLKSSLEELSILAKSESDCALIIDSSFTKLIQLHLRSVQFGLHCTENFKLVYLNLFGSVREDGAIKKLAEFCQLCVNLKRLDIIGNKIDDGRASILASGLKYCSNLEEIILCRNKLTKSGLRTIFNSLQKCHLRIKSGDIVPQNQVVTVPCLLESLTNATVYSLSLSASDFPPSHNCWEKWFSGSESNILVHSQVLQLSNVCTTTVTQARSFATVLSHCSNLRVLNLSCDGIGDEQCVALSEGIKCCQILKKFI